jgi:hypothetical protein
MWRVQTRVQERNTGSPWSAATCTTAACGMSVECREQTVVAFFQFDNLLITFE